MIEPTTLSTVSPGWMALGIAVGGYMGASMASVLRNIQKPRWHRVSLVVHVLVMATLGAYIVGS